MDNPCLSCGACCAFFRVSFYWVEADAALGGGVPTELVVPVNAHLLAMRGTEHQPARCGALQGEIGLQTQCVIYPQRPSPCRELAPWDEEFQPNDKCERARAAHGLPPLPVLRTRAPGSGG